MNPVARQCRDDWWWPQTLEYSVTARYYAVHQRSPPGTIQGLFGTANYQNGAKWMEDEGSTMANHGRETLGPTNLPEKTAPGLNALSSSSLRNKSSRHLSYKMLLRDQVSNLQRPWITMCYLWCFGNAVNLSKMVGWDNFSEMERWDHFIRARRWQYCLRYYR